MHHWLRGDGRPWIFPPFINYQYTVNLPISVTAVIKVSIGDKHSRWMTVLSGVPQRSELGPLLFVLFIYDTDDRILSKNSKFADDIKLCRAVGYEEEADILWKDLRRMFSWSQDWQMLFELERCSVILMEKRNQELS